jgi:hypothetical protein
MAFFYALLVTIQVYSISLKKCQFFVALRLFSLSRWTSGLLLSYVDAEIQLVSVIF